MDIMKDLSLEVCSLLRKHEKNFKLLFLTLKLGMFSVSFEL